MSQYLTIDNGRWKLNVSSSPLQDSHQPGNVSAFSSITLPSSMTYEGVELLVYLNGVLQVPLVDYNYVGSGTKTQIAFTKDIITTDRISYSKNKEIS